MSEPAEDSPNWPSTDDADWQTVLRVTRGCAMSWVPDARILGNVRAGDIVKAIDVALDQERVTTTLGNAVNAAMKTIGDEYKRAEEAAGENRVLRETLVRIVDRCDAPMGTGRSKSLDSIAKLAADAIRDLDAS